MKVNNNMLVTTNYNEILVIKKALKNEIDTYKTFYEDHFQHWQVTNSDFRIMCDLYDTLHYIINNTETND